MSFAGISFQMIHYVSTFGVGDAWVANELHELDRAGIPYVLHAVREPPSSYHSSNWAKELRANTRYIYPIPGFGTLWSAIVAPVLFRRRYFSACLSAFFGERENWRARVAVIVHFFVACHWARMLRHENLSHVHSQWAHSGATIGMYACWLLGKSFSFTGHACDLFRDRVALWEKISRAEFIVCISEFHRQFFLENGAQPNKLIVVYCGIDPTLFTAGSTSDARSGRFHILASCRLVEKKGLRYLLDACRLLLDQGIDFTCTIGGSGPLEGQLREYADELELGDRVVITGKAIQQEDIPEFMHSGDVYCLPCVWAADGDVDGLPQMLMEAMACGLPVVSTRLVGIPDLVVHEETGLLVEPNEAVALAEALARYHRDRALRRKLSIAGREYVLERFDIRDCLSPLLDMYRRKLGLQISQECGKQVAIRS
ncbi:MAG: glycosyltransferase [Pirellulales bacterium]